LSTVPNAAKEAGMWRGALVAGAAAIVLAMSPASPVRAGVWEYDPAADLILYNSVPVAPWYRQEPWIGTGPGHYYSHHPHHVPGYPHRLTGYPVPIYAAPRPLPGLAVRGAVIRVYRARPASHVAWCAQRYRSYDMRTDTFQPYHGPRRLCRSPWR
jgi:hypothetical protein